MTAIDPLDADGSGLQTRDHQAIVDEWMAVQLITERQMYALIQGPLARRLRGLSLLELDVITQLEQGGQRLAELAEGLQIKAEELRLVVGKLVRRGLLARQGRGPTALLRRTAEADQLISLLRQAQARLLSGIFAKMPADLQGRTVELLKTMMEPPTSD